MLVKLFWFLAKKLGTESLQNIFTGEYYLHRCYPFGAKLINGVAGKYGDSRICLNYFTGSDLPFEHNHPWGYFTLVLSGGYYEIINGERFWRGPGWFAFRNHDQYHRVEIPEGKTALTFFVKGKRQKNSTWFKLDNGDQVKDLKYWKQNNISREKIGNMIVWRTPQEISNELGR